MDPSFLAFDIGASSGRAMLGTLKNGQLSLTEIYRFKNAMMPLRGHYYWNIYSLFEALKEGLKKCIEQFGIQPQSIGIDTWGVDFTLLDGDGDLLGLPYAYRDPRTDGIMDDFFKIMDQATLYQLSGLQFMQFNTLFQLFASVKSNEKRVQHADRLLFMPDTLNYLFTGIKKCEYTIASTSALLRPGEAVAEPRLFETIGLSKTLLPDIILPGTLIGVLLPEVCNATGSASIPCVAVASHDTASAVAAVPAEGDNWAYISSGTWSLMGIESRRPIVNEKTLALNFTNEGGVFGTTRFLKNIMGLWLLQECKRQWEWGSELSWEMLIDGCRSEDSFRFLVDPDNQRFLNPDNMPEAIQSFCRESGQQIPTTQHEITRCIFDSLALKYLYTLEQLEEVTGAPIEKIHLIGGGAINALLCQLTADVTGRPVLTGPVEATATGNILMQAYALGFIESHQALRRIVHNSFDPIFYTPGPGVLHLEAYQQFKRILHQNV